MNATIYNVSVTPKSTLRVATSEAIQEFLARGGQVEVVKARKAPKQKMRGKTSRGFLAGTSGFPRPI